MTQPRNDSDHDSLGEKVSSHEERLAKQEAWQQRTEGFLKATAIFSGLLQMITVAVVGFAVSYIMRTIDNVNAHAVDLATTNQKIASLVSSMPHFSADQNEASEAKLKAEIQAYVTAVTPPAWVSRELETISARVSKLESKQP